MPIQEILVGLPELETLIQGLEQKYGFSTTAFYTERESCLDQMEEDDIFRWDMYVSQRRELRRVNDEVKNDYLSTLKFQNSEGKSPTPEDQVLLAA
jgi:hypothetical protein